MPPVWEGRAGRLAWDHQPQDGADPEDGNEGGTWPAVDLRQEGASPGQLGGEAVPPATAHPGQSRRRGRGLWAGQEVGGQGLGSHLEGPS